LAPRPGLEPGTYGLTVPRFFYKNQQVKSIFVPQFAIFNQGISGGAKSFWGTTL